MSETRLGRALVSVLPVMLVACAAVGVALFYLVRPSAAVLVGRVSDFPPSENPYRVPVANNMVFVVNTGAEIMVIEPQFESSDGAWNYDVVWVPTNGRYEDPTSGAKFTLTGEWIGQPGYVSDALEHRGLGRYPVEVRGDEVWLTALVALPGPLLATACPPTADC